MQAVESAQVLLHPVEALHLQAGTDKIITQAFLVFTAFMPYIHELSYGGVTLGSACKATLSGCGRRGWPSKVLQGSACSSRAQRV